MLLCSMVCQNAYMYVTAFRPQKHANARLAEYKSAGVAATQQLKKKLSCVFLCGFGEDADWLFPPLYNVFVYDDLGNTMHRGQFKHGIE